MSMPGPLEWVVILFVALLLFGPKRLPEFGRAVGEAIREFRKSLKEGLSEEEEKGKNKE